MAKIKRRLTHSEEFDILKLVLDKFLWLGFIVMAFGVFILFQQGLEAITTAVSLLAAGALILVLFMMLIVKEYEIIK